MNLALWAVAAYLLYQYTQGGTLGGPFFPVATVATPGVQVSMPGGFSITVPGGATYHLANGDRVTVLDSREPAPGEWVQGVLASTDQDVWFNPATSQVQPVYSYE